MENSTPNSITTNLGNTIQFYIPLQIRFWLYVIPNMLSVVCSVFVLFHLLRDRTLRHGLHNHIIIVLLIIGLLYELTSGPLMLYWFQFGSAWKFSVTFAHFWTLVDYFCYSTQLVGFGYASVERHILIFYSGWLSTKKKRFWIHYFPISAVIIYSIVYYIWLVLFPFCAETNLQSAFNGVPVPCTWSNPIVLRYNTICHQFIPVLLIIVSNIALFARVIRQKYRLNRSVAWRKQRKMTIQLLSIATLYFIFMGPRTLFQFCRYIGYNSNEITLIYYHCAFFANYIIFLFPLVCCGSMPELGKKLKKMFYCHRQQQRSIAPAPLNPNANPLMTHPKNHLETTAPS